MPQLWCWRTRTRLVRQSQARQTNSSPGGCARHWPWSISACSITSSSQAARPSHLLNVDCFEPVDPLLRQIHLAHQSPVARVATQAAEIGVDLEPREAHISLRKGALSPFERLLLFSAPGMDLGDLIGGFLLGDQLLENSL